MHLRLARPLHKPGVTKRITLPPGALYTISGHWHGMRVVSGMASIVWSDGVVVLSSGEAIQHWKPLERLISAEGKTLLTFEVWHNEGASRP